MSSGKCENESRTNRRTSQRHTTNAERMRIKKRNTKCPQERSKRSKTKGVREPDLTRTTPTKKNTVAIEMKMCRRGHISVAFRWRGSLNRHGKRTLQRLQELLGFNKEFQNNLRQRVKLVLFNKCSVAVPTTITQTGGCSGPTLELLLGRSPVRAPARFTCVSPGVHLCLKTHVGV